jgi:mannose/fructose-specific phosphotransferase system component IIA
MSALRGVVVGHGQVPAALVAAAEEISGIHDALVAVSNAGLGREALERRVLEAAGDGPAVLFVDLPSGSCLFAALRQVPQRPDLKVVTGVNLLMLLEFLFHREGSAEEVARHAADCGARSIGAR